LVYVRFRNVLISRQIVDRDSSSATIQNGIKRIETELKEAKKAKKAENVKEAENENEANETDGALTTTEVSSAFALLSAFVCRVFWFCLFLVGEVCFRAHLSWFVVTRSKNASGAS
jgi:hypothetical protein